MKNLFIHIRSSIKLIFVLIAGTIIILAAIKFIYKPMYSVTFNGEFIGYVQDKDKLENKIKDYMKNGEGVANVAFVDIPVLPQYEICLLKKDKVANDEEIYNTVKATGTIYYRYYAVKVGEDEKGSESVGEFTLVKNLTIKNTIKAIMIKFITSVIKAPYVKLSFPILRVKELKSTSLKHPNIGDIILLVKLVTIF